MKRRARSPRGDRKRLAVFATAKQIALIDAASAELGVSRARFLLDSGLKEASLEVSEAVLDAFRGGER